ncbi:MAG: hypothetical protein GXP31_12770 [Kiritimatiellaeota bacterium]|nr:hypothetical protein [Kiritimatiellota bacterium]
MRIPIPRVRGPVSRLLALGLTFAAAGRAAPSLTIIPDRNYYTTERQGELLARFTDSTDKASPGLLSIRSRGLLLVAGVRIEPGKRLVTAWPVGRLPVGKHQLDCLVVRDEKVVARTQVEVRRLSPKANAVKVDRISGGLIVDGLPFFPFGFYCYSPVQPTLAEEEIVRGFNMMSPYQSNSPDSLPARRAYMDRCAELGMKVHYQLLRVAGGGGVARGTGKQAGKTDKIKLLEAEVRAFRDHPALLGWYIADEPTGRGTSPAALEVAAAAVRALDPYHPVTIVFMRPRAAVRYEAAMDVVMADPYPIPRSSPAIVGQRTADLVRTFRHRLPVWIVPQAFGGNEWWKREPTPAEERLMTYLAVIRGATGIQYFIRHGLNGFPKSTTAWAECAAVGLEVAELTPFLLSHEARPETRAIPASVRSAAWQDRGWTVVLAANERNRPAAVRLSLPGRNWSGKAQVMFEDRDVAVKNGVWEDMIDAYGTRAYRLDMGGQRAEKFEIHPANRIVNPSFENNPVPGVPAGCYASVGRGRGATYFTDPRVALHGRRSLRLHRPTADDPVGIRPYRVSLRKGRSYCFSVWGRALAVRPVAGDGKKEKGREKKEAKHHLFGWIFGRDRKKTRPAALPAAPVPVRFSLSAPGLLPPHDRASFTLTPDWRLYCLSGPASDTRSRCIPSLKLDTPGTAWFDLMQFTDDPVVIADSPFVGRTRVRLETQVDGGEIRYTLDGTVPNLRSPRYTAPFEVSRSVDVRACVYRNGAPVGGVMRRKLATAELRPALRAVSVRPGLRCSVYLAPEKGWTKLPDFNRLRAVKALTAATPGVQFRPREDLYALRFTGFLLVPADGLYTFYLSSDDGSRFVIGDTCVVDNDGLHSQQEVAGSIALAKGPHAVAIEFFEAREADVLELQWSGPGISKQPVPAAAFRH